MTDLIAVEDYQARIAELEDELDEMTMALSQAWDQLVPLLQDAPEQNTRTQDVLPLLEAVSAATETEMAAIYLLESNDFYIAPMYIALPLALMTALRGRLTRASTEQPIYLESTEDTLLYRTDWLFLPLIVEGEAAGAIGVGVSSNTRDFTALDLRILKRMAERVAGQVVAEKLAHSRAQQARLARELEIANTIQRSIQPAIMPATDALEIAAVWNPARRVGGDAWGWVLQPNETLCCFLLDVAGKGLPAALAAVSLQTAIRMALGLGMTPVEALQTVNAEFYDAYTATDLMATASIIAIDLHTGEMAQANAGHPPTLIRHCGEWIRLEATAPPVGVLPELDLEPQSGRLSADDLVIFYSDGFSEIETERGLWGEEGLLYAVTDEVKTAEAALAHIISEADGVRLTPDIHDDQTLVVIQWH
jgi:serine phosphatase RsbU (regulator of sigma subunit)